MREQLPETDLTLTINPGQAHRHLAMLQSYADLPNTIAADPHDERQKRRHPAFTFVIARAVEGDEQGPVQLSGTLAEHLLQLVRANRSARNNVYVEWPLKQAIVAEILLKDDLPVPCEPSITIGAGLDNYGKRQTQLVYLFDRSPTKEERDMIAAALRAYGAPVAAGDTVPLYLAGFFDRTAKPALVHAEGSRETQGDFAVRWDAAELAQTLTAALAAQEA
jgi:hypothetical protein